MDLSTFFKSVGAAALLAVSYLNHALSPLWIVLVALVTFDILFAHKEGKQLEKLGSACAAIGLPAIVINNLNSADIGKIIVTCLCLVYVQIVMPQLRELSTKIISKIHFSSNPLINQADQEMTKEEVQIVIDKLQDKLQSLADQEKESLKQAGTKGLE